MRWALPVVLLSGCGRFAFDASTSDAGGGDGRGIDVPIGHDEDGDGVADVSDSCPHIADATNADGDGDGVGDICDPDPAVPTQHWIAFSPMIGDDNVIAPASSTWTMGADSWDFTQATNPQNLIRTDSVTNVDVWVGVDITTTSGGVGRQLAIVIRDMNNNPYFYGELFDSGSSSLHIQHYDGASYNAIASTAYGAFPTNTSITEHLQARTSPPTFTFFVDGLSTTATTTGYVSGQFILIATGGCSGHIRYIAIVGS